MDRRISRLTCSLVVALAVVACSNAVGPSRSPRGSATASASPSPGGVDAGYLLRATRTQAIPPIARFGLQPGVTVTGDRQVVVEGPVPAIYPGPLLPNLRARPISPAGFEMIADKAAKLGLLTGSGDFTPPDAMPGSARERIEIVIDGVHHDLTGDPDRVIVCVTTPCDPAPGTPEAFGAFWQSLSDLTWLGSELGQESPYVAPAYALLIGVEPPGDPAIKPGIVAWPLATPLATLGKPVGNEPAPRCASVRGADASTLAPAFAGANQLTRWSDQGGVDQGTAIQVRPMVPGEDVCQELFGVSG